MVYVIQGLTYIEGNPVKIKAERFGIEPECHNMKANSELIQGLLFVEMDPITT